MKQYSKHLYIATLSVLAILLLLDYANLNFPVSITPAFALLAGLIFALIFGQPYPKFNKKMSKSLLQYSVVGLGFGMNLTSALASGKEGMTFTIISVAGTMIVGLVIGKYIFKLDKDTAYLISSGTAICGGSAIAAVGPVIKAKESSMTVALGTVFILNAVALFIFPYIGTSLGMTQQQFGTWAAIAIHDTSSVVGAGAAFGEGNGDLGEAQARLPHAVVHLHLEGIAKGPDYRKIPKRFESLAPEALEPARRILDGDAEHHADEKPTEPGYEPALERPADAFAALHVS